jgi:hypothetical protein
MSAKELLAAATPLPWEAGKPSLLPAGRARLIWNGQELFATSWRAKDTEDAALIVYAVNRLPDYEAAVDALGRVVALADSFLAITEPSSEWATTMTSARAALARLRGTP